MKKYTFSASITVSAMTLVYTDEGEEKAREIAEEREAIIDEQGQLASDYWSVQEIDGTPRSIELEEIEEV